MEWIKPMEWITDELLFYGGIGIAAVAAVVLVVCILALHITRKRLNKKLELEYGPVEGK